MGSVNVYQVKPIVTVPVSISRVITATVEAVAMPVQEERAVRMVLASVHQARTTVMAPASTSRVIITTVEAVAMPAQREPHV